MSAEKNLYKIVKDKLSDFNPIRIETTTINGFPDLILFNKKKRVLFIECKVCERSRLLQSLRPHQKAFHHKYKQIMNGLFILQRSSKRERFFCIDRRISIFLQKMVNLHHFARSTWANHGPRSAKFCMSTTRYRHTNRETRKTLINIAFWWLII